MLPCSVTATAGIFSSATRSSSSPTRQAPSSSENSVCRCRWTNSFIGARLIFPRGVTEVPPYLGLWPGALGLFPFDRGRRFRADVEHDAIDATHFVHDARRHAGEQIVRQPRPVGGHAVAAFAGANAKRVLVST